uniref:efflux transporter outer membrane subunit n=1 Tax=Ningiella ruwaisensis TaxID=2364274 RepID=UPI0010A09EE9|nr:efflux transporter outer membrane subunit [Ningiella ruwaisensis]
MRIVKLSLFVGALASASCSSLAPEYSQPKSLSEDQQWSDLTNMYAYTTTSSTLRWWTKFQDEQLSELLARASGANFDVKEAYLRINEAKSRFRIETGRKLPEVTAGGGASRIQSSENGQIPLGQLPGAQTLGNFYDLGLSASWEPDLFGRLESAINAADARLAMSRHDYESVMIALHAQVATTYFETKLLFNQLQLTHERVKIQQRRLKLQKLSISTGALPKSALLKEQSALDDLQSQLSVLEAAINQSRNRLAVLVGETPNEFLKHFQLTNNIEFADTMVPIGLPSDLLKRRPDIKRAERELTAQTAEVGIARANLFPRFSLTGDVGFEATDFSDLFDSDSFTWSLGGMLNFTVPLLSGQRLNEQLTIAESEQKRAELRYQHVIVKSIQEVETTLIDYVENKRALKHQQRKLKRQKQSLEYANLRFQSGHTSFYTVIEEKEGNIASQLAVLDRQADVIRSVIALYLALGGDLSLAQTTENQRDPLEES